MKIIRILLALGLLATSLNANPGADTVPFKIDKAHSRIGFSVRHMVISKVRGHFTKYTATLNYDESNIANSSAEVTIDVNSINTENKKRDNHLRSPDFFAVEEYPNITFKSSEIKKDGDNYLATGALTIRGVTKQVSFPFEITGKIVDPWGNTRIGIEGSLKINRKDFGVKWSKVMDGGGLVVSDDVNIDLVIEAVQKKSK